MDRSEQDSRAHPGARSTRAIENAAVRCGKLVEANRLPGDDVRKLIKPSVAVMHAAIAHQRPTLLVVVDSTSCEYYSPSERARLALIEKALNARLKQRARLDGAAIYEFPAVTSATGAP